jgi:predicted AAA+ superfamily ATPase
VKDDIRDVELVRDLSSLQVLIRLLPGKVGSLFSLNALREDLMAAHKSVALWVEILERFYYHFRIYPYQSTLVKSLRKEPKLYLWDWSEIEDPSIRFENMVAGHLLKFCHSYYNI